MTRFQRAGVYVVLAFVVALAFSGLRVPAASAQGSDSCPHEPTISSLQTCVEHAATAGFITNQGVAQSLLAKLHAAEAADDRRQPDVAAHMVQAFSREVEAQRGTHIQAAHADEMLMHAESVIAALGGG